MKHFLSRWGILPLFLLLPVFSLEAQSVYAFSEKINGTLKYGIRETSTSKILLGPTYDFIGSAKENHLVYKDGSKYGFLTPTGSIAIQAQYQGAEDFSEGLALVSNGTHWGYINTANQLVIPYKFPYLEEGYAYISGFANGLAVASLDYGKTGFIDKKGNWVIQPTLPGAYPFNNANAAVIIKASGELFGTDYYGVISRKGNLLFPAEYTYCQINGNYILLGKSEDCVSLFGTGKGQACLLALADTNGKLLSDFEFSDFAFYDNLPFIKAYKNSVETLGVPLGGNINWLDKNGRKLFSEWFNNCEEMYPYLSKRPDPRCGISDYGEGLFNLCKDEKWGYLNEKGQIVIPFQYKSAASFKNGQAYVEDDKQGYSIDKNGKVLKTFALAMSVSNLPEIEKPILAAQPLDNLKRGLEWNDKLKTLQEQVRKSSQNWSGLFGRYYLTQDTLLLAHEYYQKAETYFQHLRQQGNYADAVKFSQVSGAGSYIYFLYLSGNNEVIQVIQKLLPDAKSLGNPGRVNLYREGNTEHFIPSGESNLNNFYFYSYFASKNKGNHELAQNVAAGYANLKSSGADMSRDIFITVGNAFEQAYLKKTGDPSHLYLLATTTLEMVSQSNEQYIQEFKKSFPDFTNKAYQTLYPIVKNETSAYTKNERIVRLVTVLERFHMDKEVGELLALMEPTINSMNETQQLWLIRKHTQPAVKNLSLKAADAMASKLTPANPNNPNWEVLAAEYRAMGYPEKADALMNAKTRAIRKSQNTFTITIGTDIIKTFNSHYNLRLRLASKKFMFEMQAWQFKNKTYKEWQKDIDGDKKVNTNGDRVAVSFQFPLTREKVLTYYAISARYDRRTWDPISTTMINKENSQNIFLNAIGKTTGYEATVGMGYLMGIGPVYIDMGIAIGGRFQQFDLTNPGVDKDDYTFDEKSLIGAQIKDRWMVETSGWVTAGIALGNFKRLRSK